MKYRTDGQVFELRRESVVAAIDEAKRRCRKYTREYRISRGEWEMGMELSDVLALGRAARLESRRLLAVLAALDSGAEWLPDELCP